MTEPSRNVPYEDSDMRQVIAEIEELEDAKVSIRAKAAADCGVKARAIKARKKAAVSLGIKTKLLNRLLKQRKLERDLKANAEEVDEADIEIFEEASGQFSIFAPEPDEPVVKDEPVAKKAARRAKKAADAHQAKEQEEGAKVLDSVLN